MNENLIKTLPSAIAREFANLQYCLTMKGHEAKNGYNDAIKAALEIKALFANNSSLVDEIFEENSSLLPHMAQYAWDHKEPPVALTILQDVLKKAAENSESLKDIIAEATARNYCGTSAAFQDVANSSPDLRPHADHQSQMAAQSNATPNAQMG